MWAQPRGLCQPRANALLKGLVCGDSQQFPAKPPPKPWEESGKLDGNGSQGKHGVVGSGLFPDPLQSGSHVWIWQPQTLWDEAENELKTTSLAWQPSLAQAVSPGLPAACHLELGTSAFVTQERIAVNGFLSSEQPELFNFCSGWLH